MFAKKAQTLIVWPKAADSPIGWSVRIEGGEAIGIECNGLVIVKTAKEWHRLAGETGLETSEATKRNDNAD
jgi:hypothetical protein